MANKTKKIATLDFETDPFRAGIIPEPFAAGIYSDAEYVCYYERDPHLLVAKVVDYLNKNKLLVYAHNGGRFDFFFLLKFISSLMVINGRIAECRIGDCVMRDSYLLMPAPLSSYSKDEIDYNLFLPEQRYLKINKEKIKEYLYHDCKYLFEWISKFDSEFGLSLTVSGAAHRELKKTGYKITRTANKYLQSWYKYSFIFSLFIFKYLCSGKNKL